MNTKESNNFAIFRGATSELVNLRKKTMAAFLLQILSLLVLGLIPAVLLIGILAAVPAGWLVGCVIFRRTAKPTFAAENTSTTP